MSGQQYHQNMVHFLKKEITFADAGTTVTVGTLPANSVVLRGGVAVTVAFDGDTTNTLDIGTVADPNGFATVLALGTIGNIVADEKVSDFGSTKNGSGSIQWPEPKNIRSHQPLRTQMQVHYRRVRI